MVSLKISIIFMLIAFGITANASSFLGTNQSLPLEIVLQSDRSDLVRELLHFLYFFKLNIEI